MLHACKMYNLTSNIYDNINLEDIYCTCSHINLKQNYATPQSEVPYWELGLHSATLGVGILSKKLLVATT